MHFINICAVSTQYIKDSGILDYQKKGSGLSESLDSDSAGVMDEVFIDQVLRGKHFRRGIQCILIQRGALIEERRQKTLQSKELPYNPKENLTL